MSSENHLKKYWYEALGLAADHPKEASLVVRSHGPHLLGYAGLVVFRQHDFCVISTPAQLHTMIQDKIEGLTVDKVFDRQILRNLFTETPHQIIGPAWIGSVEASDFLPCHDENCRLLNASDELVFEQFLPKSSSEEVEHSSLIWGQNPTVGVFHQGELVAAAGYEVLDASVAHLGVLCSRTQRGKGFGKQAISKITQLALSEKIGIQFRTLMENLASRHAASHIGFQEFAQTISLRLEPSKFPGLPPESRSSVLNR